MEKIFCEEREKPELSEDTLAHYGVKGMKWRHRGGKKKFNQTGFDLLDKKMKTKYKVQNAATTVKNRLNDFLSSLKPVKTSVHNGYDKKTATSKTSSQTRGLVTTTKTMSGYSKDSSKKKSKKKSS